MISLLILGLFWFLFIKTYDYQISFSAKTAPGTIYSRIIDFDRWDITKSEINIKIIGKTAFKSLDQTINLKDSTYQFHWELKPLNDSITRVKVNILDKQHSLKQRLLILIGQSNFTKNSIKRIADFKLALERHLETFRIEVLGKSKRPAYQSIIYVNFSIDLAGKAGKMAENIFYLTQYMEIHGINKTGNPFMNIKHLDIQANTLEAEFCFPVESLKSYPLDAKVKVKNNLVEQIALKAIFHGNYRYSDRAWFALINYAEAHQLAIEHKPFEIYFDDPHNYSDELKWKAEVYLPLKN